MFKKLWKAIYFWGDFRYIMTAYLPLVHPNVLKDLMEAQEKMFELPTPKDVARYIVAHNLVEYFRLEQGFFRGDAKQYLELQEEGVR